MKISDSGKDIKGLNPNSSRSLESENLFKKGVSVKGNDLNSSSEVELSKKAQTFQKAKQIALESDGINHERVNQLQKLIDSGQYKINAGDVADRLVDEHLLIDGDE